MSQSERRIHFVIEEMPRCHALGDHSKTLKYCLILKRDIDQRARFLTLFDMQEAGAELAHESVLKDEVVELLNAGKGGVFIDCTLGAGGHSEGILAANSSSRVIGIDQDITAIELTKKRLTAFGDRFEAVRANFSEIAGVADERHIENVDGILADLGVSSMQLDSEERGFSFRYDAPLDMRMDTSRGETAAALLARLDAEDLANIIYRYGEERHSRRIARRIIEKRKAGEPVMTTTQLAELVKRSVPHSKRDAIHPATRTFQALRIAVNGELDILESFIDDAVELLGPGGKLAIITFHSLEDRIVKQTFQRLSGKCQCPPRIPQCMCGAVKKVEIVTRKPIIPNQAEQQRNPRSRSAKLRGCKKIDQ